MTKILILDMDGTVRVNSDADFDNLEITSGFIQSPRDQKLIPSAIAAINQAKLQGFSIVGASNQGGVAKGYKSLEDCYKEQAYTLELLHDECAAIDRIYFCPDYEGQECHEVYWFIDRRFAKQNQHFDCCFGNFAEDSPFKGQFRKPNAGMILHAIDAYQATEVIFVGDRPEDEQAAKNANVQFIHAVEWRSTYWIA
ncbi:MAG: HAD-IIIA family hydrolase [Pseudanabaena sp.]